MRSTWLAIAALGVACGARTPLLVEDQAGNGPTAPVSPRHDRPADKIDLLFMIDNSGSMADKQVLLEKAVPDLVLRLVNPKCVDEEDPRRIVGTSVGGNCARGVLEFPQVHDIHVGVVTSSLGGRGSDACGDEPSPVNGSLDAHNNDRGRLVNRGGADEHPIVDALPSNFLSWFPSNANPNPSVTPIRDPDRFAAEFADLIAGVHEHGCGFEAQLESWYRFLIQPDPYRELVVRGGKATYQGVDEVLLRQRRDFLRPDSLLAIVMLTDEDDSTVDPLSLGGLGWVYENSRFPGSANGNAPRATSACARNPDDPECRSCAFGGASTDPSCRLTGGFYTDAEDTLNIRFHQMKRRFGVDPQFPVSRYVRGLTEARVPDRDGEHPDGSPDYVGRANCSNPIFSTNLPIEAGSDLCRLDQGPRALDLVYFAVIGGVPNQLLHYDPDRPDTSALTDADWVKILGQDPLHHDYSGIDPHMLASTTPRAGLPAPNAPATADPVHGREWDTGGTDLQYACTFPLPSPRDCTQVPSGVPCDCGRRRNTPVCDSNTPTLQVRGKAYPTLRELAVARALKERGIVGSLCPIHAQPSSPDDPLYGYRPAMAAIIERLKLGLR